MLLVRRKWQLRVLRDAHVGDGHGGDCPGDDAHDDGKFQILFVRRQWYLEQQFLKWPAMPSWVSEVPPPLRSSQRRRLQALLQWLLLQVLRGEHGADSHDSDACHGDDAHDGKCPPPPPQNSHNKSSLVQLSSDSWSSKL